MNREEMPNESLLNEMALLENAGSIRKHATESENVDEDRYQYMNGNENKYVANGDAAQSFYFDPNTATANDWAKLGIREKTINTIHNFIAKGGKFHAPEDIAKIWGLHADEIKRLMPLVRIKEDVQADKFESKQPEKVLPNKKTYPVTLVDVNAADSISLIGLPGIGPRLSQRIITFRNKLGGFYAIGQVGETFGLPDSTFQAIRQRLTINASGIRKININTATLDEMKSHPYLRFAVANSIVQYRTQHGKFSSVEDLKKIMTITEEVYDKVVPYLKVE